jgi:putative glutamine amidotransferase
VKLYSALYNDFHPFDSFYPSAEKVVVKADAKLEAPGILIIWGGSDIHPALYNRPNTDSYVSLTPSPRDQAEAKLFAEAVRAGVFVVGVCRGAQLACALTGGILIQDVSGHSTGHRITTSDGQTLYSSSLHHQMMYPWEIPHELLAWSSTPKSVEYRGITDEELSRIPTREFEGSQGIVEPEVVMFPTTRCLAIQGHPEYLDADHPFNLYVRSLLVSRIPSS